MSWVSIGSALGYYYTASEECVPGGKFTYMLHFFMDISSIFTSQIYCLITAGPNFDYTYYITVTGIVGSIVNFFAVM